MEKNIIKVKNISKIYKLYDNNMSRLKEAFSIKNRNKFHKEFKALDDITFSIKKGETVGIVGTNGSGKSTLLKIITGVLSQTSGNLEVNGRISALLELGTGFNMEYTGIENIYLYGMITGLTKAEIDENVDEIIRFASIGEFIHQPVKSYSSGMFARLAFAVAVNVSPDILIVDEALSVGDMAFQEKSITKMKELRDKGTSILFVTHSLPLVRNFCDRSIWIDKGKLIIDGSTDLVCDQFQEFMESMNKTDLVIDSSNTYKKDLEVKTVKIKSVILDKESYLINEDIKIRVLLKFNKNITNYGIGIIIHDCDGKIVTLFNTVRDDIEFDKQINEIELVIPKNDFVYGKYHISVSLSDELAVFAYDKADYINSFKVYVTKNKNGVPIADGMFRAKHHWSY
jgi:ABC-type polysaccharide/polyol phosphate transport system ATPase subunit